MKALQKSWCEQFSEDLRPWSDPASYSVEFLISADWGRLDVWCQSHWQDLADRAPNWDIIFVDELLGKQVIDRFGSEPENVVFSIESEVRASKGSFLEICAT